MIPPLHLPRSGSLSRLVSILADFLAERARGVHVGDEAANVHDAIESARRGRLNGVRADGYRAELARVLPTTTDTTIPAEGRAKRDGLVSATIALCSLVSEPRDIDARAADVLAGATAADTAADAEAVGRDLVARLALAGLVAPVPVVQ